MIVIKLETKRLLLREMNMDDYDALYAVLADSDIMQHYPYTFDEKRVRGWIERNIERYRIFGFGLWAICLKDTGEMIGDCGLTMQNIGGVIKPEIGYHVRKDMQRKGYAKEAATAVRDWTFENTPFHMIFSYMKYTNEPSAKSAISWGCHQVDEFEDEVNEITKVFAITREEWLNIMEENMMEENMMGENNCFGPKKHYPEEKALEEFYLQMNKACELNHSKAIWEWLRNAPCLDDFPTDQFKLWNENGRTVCSLRPASPWPGEIVIDNLGASNAILQEVIDFAEQNLFIQQEDMKSLFIVLFDQQDNMEQLLQKKNYEKVTLDNATLCYDLQKEIPQVTLNNEYHIHFLDEVFDFDQLSKLIWLGFHYDGEIPKLNDTVPLSIKHAWLNYRSEVCSVVINEVGEYISFCGFWYDEATQTAYLEPLVTREEYQHKGLATAVVNHSLKKLKELGCKKVFLNPDEGVVSFYKKIGFEQSEYARFFQKNY